MPDDDTGTVYRSEFNSVERLVYWDPLTIQKCLEVGNVGYTENKITNEEWIVKIRELAGSALSNLEKDVICDRVVFGETFGKIAEQRNFAGGYKSVSRVYKKGLQKLKKKLEKKTGV